MTQTVSPKPVPSRTVTPLPVADLSAFTKSLRQHLQAQPTPPGHLALMNIVARAAGFRNVQHLRATQTAVQHPPAPAIDQAQIAAVLRHFDPQGRLATWPARTGLQRLAVRALWARLPARVVLTERQISDTLNRWHSFGDAAILRRTMVELKLVTRSPDCRDYTRVEAPPTPEARALITVLESRT
ncbi:DUF2087 domain-containing protein [Pseudotabrizicola sp. 4114]|uniref:DUF2087 domain-containing protein n=1 Tax=Pseudotabrizicola sp. 4114 TaxID=2817731 RepID=UPI0028543974|nr:hypothetical protein [Pseudorhodobacter sp. 4114]